MARGVPDGCNRVLTGDIMRARLLRVSIAAIGVLGAAAATASGADISPIHGHWEPVENPCMGSDQAWTISKKGASPFDSVCTLKSVKKKGNTFELTQSCSMDGELNTMIVDIRRISAKSIEIYGMRYQRCPKPTY